MSRYLIVHPIYRSGELREVLSPEPESLCVVSEILRVS